MAVDWPTIRAALEPLITHVTAEHANGMVGAVEGGQRVLVDLAHGRSTRWLVVRAAICRLSEMDAFLSLERSGELAFAAIVVSDGEYFLRAAVPLDSVESANPLELVRLAIDAARSLRPHVESSAEAARQLFGNYNDG